MFRCIPLFRGCNRQVEYIDKRHCMLANVPDDVLRYARTLEELLLDANHIRDLPKGLFRLLKLRRLSLSDNEIGRLPGDISGLMNLVELDISKNDIPDIPESIKFLKSLQVADFSSNPLSKLPSGFVQLRNLTMLNLNDVSLTQLPSDFGSLSNLQSLELRENLLKTLPPSFAFLVKLERLDLGSNEIEELPPLIGQLSSLQELWLDCNELSTLPKEVGHLKKLTCLDISENHVEILPEEIYGLESLTDFHLSQNALEVLPEGIGRFTKLTIFKVDQNRLLYLTPAIGHCISLQELILTENLLTELPESIGNLVKLTNLNVDRNRLTEIPPQIGNLTRLGVLSLRENRITYLPPETGKLKELHVLDVSGNRLQYLPITITALNLKALWLAENQSQPMLKFQTDIDPRTGMKVLTCFLLPQQEYHPESMENLLRDSVDQDSRLSWDHRAAGEKISAVKFLEDSEEDKEDKETQFIRHDTPHPRELKARHQKLFTHKGKNIDGHVVMHEEKDIGMTDSFRPQRSSTASTGSSSSETDLSHKSHEPGKAQGEVRNSISTVEEEQNLNHEQNSSDLSESNKLENTDNSSLDVSRENQKPTDEQESASSDNDVDSDDLSYREGERHVGFATDADEQPERHNKLHRRDTPHHLKNKRINVISSKEEQEKVATILAQVLKKDDEPLPPPPPSPPRSVSVSSCSGESEVVRTISPNSDVSSQVACDRYEINVHRQRAGLGLSIAGGKGSTPYKGNDEGIFVSRIIDGGPGDIAGLRVGDKVLSVNDTSVIEAGHYDAVNTLKAAGDHIKLVVVRENPVSQTSVPLPVPEKEERPVSRHQNVQIVEEAPVSTVVDDKQPLYENTNHVAKPVLAEKPKVPKPENLKMPIVNVPHENSTATEDTNSSVEYETKYEIIYTTLIRDQNGLGFSIAGGKGGTPFKDGSDGIYISRIADRGAAEKDGKLHVGDQVLSINGVDMEGARHDQAISMLTGLERYIRLVVQREQLVPRDPNAPEKSPKLFGLPRPYGSFYSAGSYMANRPSYLGSYRRPEIINTPENKTPPAFSIYTKLPGLRNEPFTTASPTMTITTTTVTYSHSNSPITTTSGVPNHLHDNTRVSYAHPPTTFSTFRPELSPQPNGNCATPERSTALQLSNPMTVATQNNVAVRKGPLVTVTIQQAEPYVPLGPQLPPAPTDMGRVKESLTHTTVTETTTTRVTNNSKVVTQPLIEDVSLIKAGGPLGLSIIGGSNHSCHPFGGDVPGIFISKIVPDGAASKTSKLKVGDRLLKVNGEDIGQSTHQEAVMSLLAPTYEMVLTVQHDPLPKGWQLFIFEPVHTTEFILKKGPKEKLGMTIKGGARGRPGNPLDCDDEGVFISRINADGAVARDQNLTPGMRIIEVNGVSLLGASHQEAANALRNVGDIIRLLVCEGYDPSTVDDLLASRDSLNIDAKMSQSLSSLDREDEGTYAARQEQEVLKEAEQWEKEDQEKVERLWKERERTSPVTNSASEKSFSGQPVEKPVTTIANCSPQSNRAVVLHEKKTVDQKVLEVVRAAEQLVKPLAASAEILSNDKLIEPKDKKTTTIIMTKHSVSPQTSTPLSAPRARPNALPLCYPQSPSLSPDITPTYHSTPLPGDLELNSSSDSLLDPVVNSKLPGAKPLLLRPNKLDQDDPNSSQPERLTFSEKKRRFEQGIQQQALPVPNTDHKRFSYLSEDELEKMKEEEEKKVASMTEEQLHSFRTIEEDSDNDDSREELDDWNADEKNENISSPSSVNSSGGVRTAKAERRLKERLVREGLIPEDDSDLSHLTPAQQRALQAEKRAAWRQARLKSLEEDAVKAQMVITKVKEMTEAMQHKMKVAFKTVDIDIAEDADVDNAAEADKVDNAPCEEENGNEQNDPEAMNSGDWPILKPTSNDFPYLTLASEDGARHVVERERVVGENIVFRTEQYLDKITGQYKLRTVECREKIIEKEIEITTEKIMKLELANTAEDIPENGTEEERQPNSEPQSPTTTEGPSSDGHTSPTKKKKKRKSKHR